MADQDTNETERVRWVKSSRYVLNRVDGTTTETTDKGSVLINFFVTYTAVEADFEFERGTDGEPVNTRGGRNMDTIMEFQQGVLLDEADARTLRDELNEILDAKDSEHASS